MASIGASSCSSSGPQKSSSVPTASWRRTDEAKKRKCDRLADDQAELLRRQLGLGAFLHAEGRDAQRLHRRLMPGTAGIDDSTPT